MGLDCLTVKEVLSSGIKVAVSKDDDQLYLIKKSELAKDVENQRTNIFSGGEKVDCMIVGLDKKKRKVSLSIKELEIQNEKIAIKKYGGTSSGQSLKNIFGKAFGSKKTKDKKKEDKK